MGGDYREFEYIVILIEQRLWRATLIAVDRDFLEKMLPPPPTDGYFFGCPFREYCIVRRTGNKIRHCKPGIS